MDDSQVVIYYFSYEFSLLVSPRRLFHRLCTKMEDMSIPSIIVKSKEKLSSKEEIVGIMGRIVKQIKHAFSNVSCF
jgi:ribosomal protein L7Ae-like RNA K-turn-binding protein